MARERQKPAEGEGKKKMTAEDFAALTGGIVGKIGTEDRFLAAMLRTRGNIAAAGELLGVTRQTAWAYFNSRPALQERFNDLRETRVDNAESMLEIAVAAGNIHAIMFTLKTLGKDRGYTERKELTGAGDSPIQIETRRTSSFDSLDVTAFTPEEMIEFRDLAELVEHHRGNALVALNAEQLARLRTLMDKGTVRVIEHDPPGEAVAAVIAQASEDPSDDALDISGEE